ncbi:MAG: RICIN domain-containing protein [Eggerthellaceae bacterium]|nr:RICIN domain-containing protein [Eggerthellaceae bacterium]
MAYMPRRMVIVLCMLFFVGAMAVVSLPCGFAYAKDAEPALQVASALGEEPEGESEEESGEDASDETPALTDEDQDADEDELESEDLEGGEFDNPLDEDELDSDLEGEQEPEADGGSDGEGAGGESGLEPRDLQSAELDVQAAAANAPKASVKYQAHVQGKGWMPEVADGAVAGTEGQALRLESLRITVTGDVKGAVQCQAHVQGIGWTGLSTGSAGTTGQSKRLEAVRLVLTGDVSQWYDISYRVHVQKKGWMGWVSNGAVAGTTGQALRIEAIEVVLEAKAAQTSASEGIIGVRTAAHVQSIGWQAPALAGETSGTTGQSKRVEALKISLDAGTVGGGITYNVHVQRKGWINGVSNGAVAGTTGQSLRMEAVQISLTGAIAQAYDVVYRAHVQSLGWQPWTLNGGTAGTTGQSKRVEALQVKLVKKGSDPDIAEGAYIIAAAKDPTEVLYVAGNSESSGARMQVSALDMSSFGERFYVRKSGGAVTVQAATSGLYLADSGSAVVQAAQSGADSQRWRFSWDGGYQLLNVATGKALALASTAASGVYVNPAQASAGSALQRWTLTDAGIVPDGVYTFGNVSSGRVLDVQGANRRDGANVMIYDSNNGNNQKFAVAYLGSGQYSVRNAVTTRAVQASGANVQMQGWSGAAAQKWRADLVGAKTFRFVNVSTGTAMDVAGHATANSSNVVVSSGTADSQRFRLTATKRVSETVSIGVPVIFQNPELPTGCESVALTEALNYYGFNLGKTTIADNYMPWSGDDFVYSFMGNPHTSYGAAIMAPGITNTANKFLSSRGSSLRATNITGSSFGSLYDYLDQGIPVVVWNTMYMHDPGYVQAYEDGYAMRSWTHAVTLSGYNPFNNTVLVADPLDGGVWRDRGRFEWLYNEMGRQAVIIK